MTQHLKELDNELILHPQSVVGLERPPLIISRAKDATLWDVDGNEYIDGTCGLWQCPVGHGREEIAEVAAQQMAELEYFSSFGDYSNVPSITLAQKLVELAPSGIKKVFFTNGGSEGNETAIKLARFAQTHAGRPQKTKILARDGGYHGMGGSSLAVTGIPRLTNHMGELMPGVEWLMRPDAANTSLEALIDDLRQVIERVGAENIAAMIGEPILGVSGMILPPEGYWEQVQVILRENNILLILDEVVTGFGRTGKWFAAEYYGIQPDMIVTAKGISSGYVPMGAVLLGERVLELADGGMFAHGFTYSGHPVGAAVALKNIEILEREQLIARGMELGSRIREVLRPLEALEGVKEIRSIGTMIGIETTLSDISKMQSACRERGVIVRATESTLVISPPLVMPFEQAERMAAVIRDVVTEAVNA